LGTLGEAIHFEISLPELAFPEQIVTLALPRSAGHLGDKGAALLPLNTQKEFAGDAIHIEQLEVLARIGVPEDERSQPQRLTISITLWPTTQGVELGDDIGRVVDYAAVCAETKKFVQNRFDRLIETLADALANHLLQFFAIERITVELRKFILPDVNYVSVTVTRDRLVN
jgi:dihydroneopterin aldolase